MADKALTNGSKIIVTIKAEWPEEDRKALQEKIDEFSAALDAANEKADALMEKMKQLQEIGFSYSETQP